MSILDHENVIKFHESFETFDYQIYVIELVKGHDLFKHVVDKEFLEEVEASFIFNKILQAVDYLHIVGLVHRDLKPENIMVIVNGKSDAIAENIKIIDFGFAAYLEDLNSTSTPCGTLNYVAPEIYTTQKFSFQADSFALGVILYFMIKGELPFTSDVPEILIGNIVNGNYSLENDDHFLNVSNQCKDLIKQMLEIEPEKRITIREALNHPFIKDPKALEKYHKKNRIEFDFNNYANFHCK